MAAHGAPRRCWCSAAATAWRCARSSSTRACEQVTLVELDPHMTRLFADRPAAGAAERTARCARPRLHVDQRRRLHLAGDPPRDASTSSSSTSPTRPTSRSASSTRPASTSASTRHLAAGGYAVVQTTSPLIARKQLLDRGRRRIEAVGLRATPYHAHVPSFGEWGFVIAGRRPWRMPTRAAAGPALPDPGGPAGAAAVSARHGARARQRPTACPNQVLVHTFDEEWGRVAALTRRAQLHQAPVGLALAGCGRAPRSRGTAGGWVGASVERGHRLRDAPSRCRRRPCDAAPRC